MGVYIMYISNLPYYVVEVFFVSLQRLTLKHEKEYTFSYIR